MFSKTIHKRLFFLSLLYFLINETSAQKQNTDSLRNKRISILNKLFPFAFFDFFHVLILVFRKFVPYTFGIIRHKIFIDGWYNGSKILWLVSY